MPITITPGVVISPGMIFSTALPTATAVGYLTVAGGGGSANLGGGGAGGFRSSSGYAAQTSGSNYYQSTAGGFALTGDFTIEYWYSNNTGGVIFNIGSEGNKRAQFQPGYIEVFGSDYGTPWTWTPGTNVWNHVAVVRSGTTVTIYENGVLQATKTANGQFGNAGKFYIGSRSDGGINPYNGRVSDIRVLSGTALYTGNFTPPTEPLTAIANTIFLVTSSASTMQDSSSSAYGISAAGSPTYTAIAPTNLINFAVSAGSPITVTVGGGGGAGTASTQGSTGSNSVFSTITSAGGGGSGGYGAAPANNGLAGGSGGGGAVTPSNVAGTGGAGNTPSVTPSQGNSGGNGNATSPLAGGGGGGAGGFTGGGTAPSGTVGGAGGTGAVSFVTGSNTVYAGGGGGGASGTGGAAGTGGGGAGTGTNPGSGNAGTTNLGGGAGGGYNSGGSAGGSGVVIIAYPTDYANISTIDAGLTYSFSTVTRTGYRVYTFTAGTGNITF